jgi:hypothetical protein
VEGLLLVRQDPKQVLINFNLKYLSVAVPDFSPVPGLFPIGKMYSSLSPTGSGSGRVLFGIGTGVRFRTKRVSAR